MEKTKKLTLTALLTAAALILGWVEHVVPIVVSIPGIKLGISNIAVVFALYRLGRGYSASVMGCKVTLSALIFGGFSSFVYSAAGGMLSLAAMILVYRAKWLSPIGVSAVGGAAHITAQVLVAVLFTSTPQIIWLLAPLVAVGTATGALTGFIAALLIRKTCSLSQNGSKSNAECS